MVKIPKYCRHKASGQACVTLYGKGYYLGKYGTKDSRTKYARLISEYLKAKGQEVPPEVFNARRRSQNITVIEAADCYLTWLQTHHSAAERFHVHGMLRHLIGLYENERAANIGPAELREIRASMIRKGWSRNYVNEQVARLKRMYKWLAAEPLIPVTVYQALTVVSGLRRGDGHARETEPVLPVDDATVDATLPHLPEVVADMVRLQRLTGMRPAELCFLQPCDLDRSSDVWLYRPKSHKTLHHGRDRVIFIGPRAQDVLLRYLARDNESYCFAPRDSEAKRRTPRGRGKSTRGFADRYDVGVYRRAIHRACDIAFPHPRLADIAPHELSTAQLTELRKWKHEHRWSPNQLRHAAATEVRRAFGLEAAQVVLGHARADVTQIYAERDISKGAEVARRIG